MRLRARTRPMLRHAGLLVALTALLVPAFAGTAQAAKTAPVVRKAAPKHVYVGETLTIRGHHFRRGVAKNSVAFKRKGARVMFVKAGKSTTKLMKVTLPTRLDKLLVVKSGMKMATRLQIRVLSSSFGKRFTKRSKSPIVGPARPPAPDPNGDCDLDGQKNIVDTDDDNDLLIDTLEFTLALDSCKADHDGDGIEDGFEYQSALDLNYNEHQTASPSVPYPGKRPYSNPLDPTDKYTDHDGDSLTLVQEFQLWQLTIANGSPRTRTPLSYSAGMQYSIHSVDGLTGHRSPALRAANYDKQAAFLDWAGGPAGYARVALSDVGAQFQDGLGVPWHLDRGQPYEILDFNRSRVVEPAETEYYRGDNTYLNDAERDEDADGLPNWWETSGCMTPGFWKALYDKEVPYPLTYTNIDFVDKDSDGDDVRDGADDEDHDGVPNVMECSRDLARTGNPPQSALGAVNPFNPCMPHQRSQTCPPYIEIGAKWAPFGMFDAAGMPEPYLSKN